MDEEPIQHQYPILHPDTSTVLDEGVRSEIMGILSQNQHEEVISQDVLLSLVPQRVRDIAKNKDNIEVRQLRGEGGGISVLVIEKDYPDELTSPEAYLRWKQDIEVAKKAKEGKTVKILPRAPAGINRLHAIFSSDIDQGKLFFSDRILMTCKLRISPENPKALYVAYIDGESHRGIGQDFYRNTLPTFCRNLGLRFIVGLHNSKNLSFFTDTLGGYTPKQLKPEFQNTLFPFEMNNPFFVIQFLYSEDVEKYVDR